MDKLISVEEAERLLEESALPLEKEGIAIEEAYGRVLAEALHAGHASPPFRASAMDGFALYADDASPDKRFPLSLKITGDSAAGEPFEGAPKRGDAVRIQTGALLPEGMDGILPKEDAETDGEMVTIKSPLLSGRFIREKGEDFQKGDCLIEAGERLDAAKIGLAASGGHAILSVRQKARVALLASGSELRTPGQSIRRGQIISANNYALQAFLTRLGAETKDLGIVQDSLRDLKRIFSNLESHHLLITTGGVSVGDKDLILPALLDLGFETIFHGVAMRPGKVFLFGKKGKIFVMGFPGNPVSALVCAHIFLEPFLALLGGEKKSKKNRRKHARLQKDMEANESLREDYVRASLDSSKEVLLVSPFPKQGSARLKDMSRAEALIIRPPQSPPAKAGETVPIYPLSIF